MNDEKILNFVRKLNLIVFLIATPLSGTFLVQGKYLTGLLGISIGLFNLNAYYDNYYSRILYFLFLKWLYHKKINEYLIWKDVIRELIEKHPEATDAIKQKYPEPKLPSILKKFCEIMLSHSSNSSK